MQQEAPKDSNTYDICWAAADALREIDNDMRILLRDKDFMDLTEHSILNRIGLAIADVTARWPFAKLTIGIQQTCSKYEGLLKLYFAEFHFRKHATPHDKMIGVFATPRVSLHRGIKTF